jgi:two-component system, cell cycle sensor histidine kinase and response regulator CckA
MVSAEDRKCTHEMHVDRFPVACRCAWLVQTTYGRMPGMKQPISLMRMPRQSWKWRLAVSISSMTIAVTLTHLLWPLLRHTPFLLAFGAVILSSRLAGLQGGLVAVAMGALGHAWLQPALPSGELGHLVFGFVVVSSIFSWLVARGYEIESALRLSESRLREAQQVAAVGSWEWNIRDGSESWSDQMFRIFGVEPGSVTPSFEAFSEFLHPEDRPAVDRVIQRAFVDHQAFECENRILRPGGELRTIHVQGRVVTTESGDVLRLVGTAQDITDRKAAEERTARSERRLQTILDALPACVKLVSHDGVLLEMNRAGLDMIGAKSLDQIAGLPAISLVHPDDRKQFLQMHAAATTGSAARCEFRIVGLGGDELWVGSHLVPFEVSVDGQIAMPAVLSVTWDVTERRRLEDQLRQSQKMEAIGQMAGGIAHDFNNLLTAISGYTELVLLTFGEGDERLQELQEVAKAARRATALTRRLLAVSRRQILQPTVLDLNEMVADVQKLLRRTIPENIDLQLELGNPLDRVRADRGQLEQVLLNLAINAGDAMPHGGRLVIATHNVDVGPDLADGDAPIPPGRYVRLTVKDTGIGMPPQTQARIFEPFFTTKGGGEGTGLGLATVYGTVKQSGGFICVQSEVGRGTRFEVSLPVVHAPLANPPQVAPIAASVGGTQTILLAEDDAAVRRLASTVLTNHGYNVVTARDGDEALEVARRHTGPIHLLITDVVMPGLNGRDLAWRLEASRPDVRVLYISGYTENVLNRAGFESGLTLLPKPFLPADLLRTVGDVLNK